MDQAPEATPPPRHALGGRRISSWIASLVGAVVLMWVASHWIDLWPHSWMLPRPELLIAAAAMQIPYALIRAMRLRFILDPLVQQASGGGRQRFPVPLLIGSGLVGSLVVLVLPLKLGEFWRPFTLAAGRERGVRMTEGIGAVAVERLLDGLMIVALLFGGLALGESAVSQMPAKMAYIPWSGALMGSIFIFGLAVLVLAARSPERFGRACARPLARISTKLSDRAGSLMIRVVRTFCVLLDRRKGFPFVAWSMLYWGITVTQLWLVAQACGLALGPAEAAAVVGIVGLAIQLPGGPAQTGNFHVGMGLALALFVGGDLGEGIPSAVASFTTMMYFLSLGGAAVMALPGLLLLEISKRRAREASLDAGGTGREEPPGGPRSDPS